MDQMSHSLEGLHYQSGNRISLEIRDGVISSLEETVKDHVWNKEEASGLPVVAPGLIDLQVNGYRGVDFNDPILTPEQIGLASKNLQLTGVTTYYPTLITGPVEKISTLLRTFAAALSQGGLASAMIGGIHLEGPFISKEDGPRGAHTLNDCLDPDLELMESWQKQAQGKIKLVTLAPELPGSIPFIRELVAMGILVGLGHTAADSDQIKRAVDAGASLSTHLGNGCHSLLPRHPNYIWDQLAHDQLYASMIADGFHLPDSVLQVFSKSKGDKAILISDGMTYTGLEPGIYDSSATGRVCLTPEGKLHQEGKPGTLAGSATTLINGVRKMSSLVGFSKAWDMGSLAPARLMNLDKTADLKVGAAAHLVLLEPDLSSLRIRSVFQAR